MTRHAHLQLLALLFKLLLHGHRTDRVQCARVHRNQNVLHLLQLVEVDGFLLLL